MGKINQPYRDFIRSLGCVVGGKDCFGDILAHHVKTKGAGHGDEYNLVPLCFSHHTWNNGVHAIGKIRFEEKYSLNLEDLAVKLYEHWGENERRKG